ncbi:MTH1187 family thiamine-binding protein [Desulfospira joergensenii]|uniref:MTH1187 family thiamine-binding protein n=1 Tax=Desulfospira joergensenii TaxID=53329 RepID=UPI0003B6F3F4|nr:MTH1187 family thiamine-binding protein [Desulfospira joergensenii]
MILSQVSVYPVGEEGTSLGRFVRKGIQVIKESGYTYSVGGLSTAIETPDLDSLFDLIKKVRQAHLDEGARRIVVDLKIDDRHDKNATLQSKITSVT